jgi:peptidyl-prolyl cis-trans isomerase B (cyclophilin B)
VATSKNQELQARRARDRLRLYNARQSVNAHQRKRRRRDNLIAAIGFVVVVAIAALTQIFYFTAGPGTPAPAPSASAAPQSLVPDPSVAENRQWTGELVLGDIPLGVTLDGAAAPQAVAAFVTGIRDGYYQDKTCHRLAVSETAGLVQCGSVDGTGGSDPEWVFGPIENAPENGVYPAGTIAMARAADDAGSNGRQFFIVFDDTTIPADSAGGYTVLGTVTSGLDRFVAEVASAGTADGSPDGPPAVATSITAASIQ